MAVLCAWLYFWSARQPVDFLFSREPAGYYGLLTAGFRHGHLAVDRLPDPRLLALPDPYDPVANAPYRVHDMTLFHGKYYLYFGVTPVLLFFWPIAVLTGWYPTEPCAVATFCLLGVLAGLTLLWAVRRRYFPAAPVWSLGLAGLCLAFASPVLVLTVESDFYQVPISCAFCLYLFMLLAVYRAIQAERRPELWLGAASLLFGLVVGARPDYLIGGAALLLPCSWLIRQNGGRLRASPAGPLSPAERAVRQRFLVATFLPAMACGVGLALYNYLRFGSFSEFGMHYQLAGEDVRNLQLLRLDHIGVNGLEYLFRAGAWQRYFPFFVAPTAKPYGFLRYAPWCCLMFLVLRARDLRLDRRLALLTATIGCGVAANFLLLSGYLGTTDRYPSDFLPAALLLGGIGALALTDRVASQPWVRRLLAPLLLALGLFSTLVGLAVFAGRTPREDALRPLARLINRPTSHWERTSGIELGDERLELELPAGKENTTEPLLETGSAPDRRDRVEIHYLADNTAQISLFHAGIGVLDGKIFSIPPSRRVAVEVRAGSLLPPFSHPFFASWTKDEYDAASREVRIVVNGAETFHAALLCYPSPPQDVRVGRVGWLGDGVAGPFSGRVLGAVRLPLTRPVLPPLLHERRPIDLEVLFPVDHPSGTEPLLVTGSGDKSDMLSCTYDGAGRLHFTSDHFGYGGTRGEVVSFDPLRSHHLVLWMGSLASGVETGLPSAAVPLSRRIFVQMDGATVFNEDGLFYPAAPESIAIGVNRFATTTALAGFSGLVLATQQTADLAGLPALRRSGETGVVELQLTFPDNVPNSAEPLVVTGVTGAGDMIYVRYLDGAHVSFGFDHWGTGGFTGAPVEIDYAQNHRLEITMDSLYPAELVPRPFGGRVRVVLDGATVLDGSSLTFPTRLFEIRIGKNPLGSSTSGAIFTGLIVTEARKNPATLPAAELWHGTGRVVMDAQFPAGLTNVAEPLVEAGAAGAADLLYVRYVDDHHVRFGVDHWGTGGVQSDPIEVDYSAPHRLELAMDALQAAGAPQSHEVHVSLDGAEVWQAPAANFPVRPDQIHVGVNTIGASSCRESFTGQILTLARPAGSR